jgi:hypothetical protein
VIIINSFFKEIILTRKERKALKYIAKHSHVNVSNFDTDIIYELASYKLIAFDYSDKKNSLGERIRYDTVSITENYLRYKKFLRNSFIERKLPIIISIIALIISFVALYFSYLQLISN